MAIGIRQGTTGRPEIDGFLSGYRWDGIVTVGFPDLATDYPASYGPEPLNGFFQASPEVQRVTRVVLGMVEALTNLRFSYVGAQTADISIAQTSYSATAHAHYPGEGDGGDAWFGSATNFRNPRVGDYAYQTIFHELGHALGLKHPHEAGGPGTGSVVAERASLSDSVMSYRSSFAAPTTGYTNETYGFPTTFMPRDIAALQAMYGVNYTTNAGDTRYTWDPFTGQSFVNGVAGPRPGSGTGNAGDPSSNRIFMTIWDGGGRDVFDFSNATGNRTINLAPGGASVFTAAQRPMLAQNNFGGSIFTSFLPDGDERALIEDAIGGSGADTIEGNQAGNRLIGNAGDDILYGYAGNDTLTGGLGVNAVYGGIGSDTAAYGFASRDAFIYRKGTTVFVGHKGGLDQLGSIEFLQFSDVRVRMSDLFPDSVDTTAPRVSLRDDNGAAAPTQLTFDDVVVAGTGYVSIFYDDGTLYRRLGWDVVTLNDRYGSAGAQSLSLNVAIEPGNYFIEIDPGFVVNAAGIPFAGLSGANTLNFYQGRLDDYANDFATVEIPVNGPATAGYVSRFDTDAFKVRLIAGQTYAFDLTTPGPNPGSAVMAINTSTSSQTYQRRGVYTATKDETITVQVRASVSVDATSKVAGDYQVEVTTVMSTDKLVDTEARIALNTRVEGMLPTADELDRLTFDVVAGRSYRVDLEALKRTTPTGAGPPPHGVFTLNLVDVASGQSVATASANMSQIVYTAASNGTLRLDVGRRDATFEGFNYAIRVDEGSFSAPSIVGITPADTQIRPDQSYGSFGLNEHQLILTFNEPVKAGTGRFVFLNNTTGFSGFVIDAASSQVRYSGNTATIRFTQEQLWTIGELTLTLDQSAVTDLAGTAMTRASVDMFPRFGGANGDYRFEFYEGFTSNISTRAVLLPGTSEAIPKNQAAWYKTTLQAGITYDVGLIGPDYVVTTTPFPTVLTVRSATGAVLASDVERSGGGFNARLLFTAPSTGEYFIEQRLGTQISLKVYEPLRSADEPRGYDITGDGSADIVWRNTADGTFTVWAIDDRAIRPNAYWNNSVDPGWTLDQQFDFNGDGRDDLLWRHGDGTFTVWNAEGAGFRQNVHVDRSVAPDWRIAATGDFDGDGRDDLIWRHADGTFTQWQSTGNGFAKNVYYDAGVPTEWQLVGTADQTGDGRDDLIWRNTRSGTMSVWASTGSGFAYDSYTNSSVDPSWSLQALGDFNGDGRADLLWRHSGGVFTIWQAEGAGYRPNAYYDNSVGPDWKIAQVADFNGDGRDDIMWRNQFTGDFSTWQSNGNGFDTNVVYFSGVGNEWQVQSNELLV